MVSEIWEQWMVDTEWWHKSIRRLAQNTKNLLVHSLHAFKHSQKPHVTLQTINFNLKLTKHLINLHKMLREWRFHPSSKG